jgi:hypothetical protein
VIRGALIAALAGCGATESAPPPPAPAPGSAPATAPPAADAPPPLRAIAVSRADPAIGDRAPCRRPTFTELARIAVPGELQALDVSDGGAAIAGVVAAPGGRITNGVVVWDARTGDRRATLTAAGPVNGVTVSADAAVLYVSTTEHGGNAAMVRALELPSLDEHWRREPMTGELALTDDGATLLVTAGDHVTGLRAADGTLVGRIGANHMTAAAAIPGTGDMITVSVAGGVERRRFGERAAIAEIRAPAHDANPQRIAVTRDGAAVATLTYEVVELFDITTGATRWTYAPPSSRMLAVGVGIGGPYVLGFYERSGPSTALVASVFRRDGKRLAEPVLATIEDTSVAAVDRSGAVIVAGNAAGALVVLAIGCQ